MLRRHLGFPSSAARRCGGEFLGVSSGRAQASLLVIALTLCGCSAKTVSANLAGYNHTDRTIAAFYVNDIWGGNITPAAGGGSFVCCVELPVPWQPGTKVTVGWEDDAGGSHQRDVEVPAYDAGTLSALNVHFLRDGTIKVFANRLSLWHPDYPLKGAEAELRPGEPIPVLPRQ